MLKVDYCPPRLEWFQIYRGNEEAGKVWLVLRVPQSAITGELLAAFEMFELGESNRQLPGLPQVKDNATANTGPILPIPQEIRPTLVKYRLTKKINQIFSTFSLDLKFFSGDWGTSRESSFWQLTSPGLMLSVGAILFRYSAIWLYLLFNY